MNAPHLHAVPDWDDDPGAGKTPPHDADAEVAVLSSLMLDPVSVPKVADFLRPQHFYLGKHRYIAAAIFSLASEARPHDVVAVGARLKEQQRIAQVGGMAYLSEIFNLAPAHVNLRQYATIVYERWRVREAIGIAQQVLARGYVGDTSNVQSFLDDASLALVDVARAQVGVGAESNVDTLRRIVKALEDRGRNGALGLTGLSYGFPSIDMQTGGMQLGELVYVIALSHVGKTTFGVNTVASACASGVGVQAFTTETTRKEYFEMLVSCVGGVDNAVWVKRTPSASEWGRIATATQEIAMWKHLAIDDNPCPSIEHIENVCRARSSAPPINGKPFGMILVDQLHNTSPSRAMRNAEKHVWLKDNSTRLKNLGRELGIPVVVLAQRRPVEVERATKVRPRPSVGDMSQCKSAEADADKIIYLVRAPLERGNRIVGEDEATLLAIFVKGRRSKPEDVTLKLVGQHGRLIDIAAESRVATSRHWTDTDPDDPLTGGL